MNRSPRIDPDLFEAMLVDPTNDIPREIVALQIKDMQRKSRRYLLPIVRIICLILARVIFIIKRILPFKLSSQKLLNKAVIWLATNFMSPEALAYSLRHFNTETSLINFVINNSGASDIEPLDQQTVSIEDLGDTGDGLNAIVRHDINIYNLIIDLGYSKDANINQQKSAIDYSALTVPELDLSNYKPRATNCIDLETCLQFLILVIAFCLDDEQIERAVNSFQLDESLTTAISRITGDPSYLTLAPLKFRTFLYLPINPARELFWHMIAIETAYSRLRLRAKKD